MIFARDARHDEHFSEANKARAEAASAEIQAWAHTSVEQFRQEVARGRAVILESGSHYVFLTNDAEVVRRISEFLNEVVAP